MYIKRLLKKSRDTIGLGRYFFILGHSRWFVFVLSLSQYALIIFNLYWLTLNDIPPILRSFETFFLVFIIIYVPLVITVGYFEARKGTFRSEMLASIKYNPVWKRLFKETNEIKEELKELKEVLSILLEKL